MLQGSVLEASKHSKKETMCGCVWGGAVGIEGVCGCGCGWFSTDLSVADWSCERACEVDTVSYYAISITTSNYHIPSHPILFHPILSYPIHLHTCIGAVQGY
jgi:hypothetical protein